MEMKNKKDVSLYSILGNRKTYMVYCFLVLSHVKYIFSSPRMFFAMLEKMKSSNKKTNNKK